VQPFSEVTMEQEYKAINGIGKRGQDSDNIIGVGVVAVGIVVYVYIYMSVYLCVCKESVYYKNLVLF
jgi:hypothetical protein